MKESIINVLSLVNDKLWLLVTLLIVLVGIYYTIKLKGIQFRIGKMKKAILAKEKNSEGLSSFKTLMLSLAGRIGVGSISGVALAIYVGGPGTIFWIWIISLLSATLAYAESFLGVKFREKDGKKAYKGGPAYYIKGALGMPKLGAIYAIFIILCYGIGYMSIQSNTIIKSTADFINLKPAFLGIILALISAFVIFGGLKKIADATSKIVPVMSLIYILLAVTIIIKNFSSIGNVFLLIVKSAFNFKAFNTGFMATLLLGVQRGIFSNEAGLGTGSMAAASGASKDAEKQGLVQMIGIYVTSLLICTATAIIVLCSNYSNLLVNDANGIEIAKYAFTNQLGPIGNVILVLSIFMFAYSTILTGYYYGESSLKYFNLKNDKSILALKILTIVIIFIGSICSPTIMWKLTDIFVACLAIINIYALIRLRKNVVYNPKK